MFSVDLLKGRGVPIKTKPGGVYLVAISFIVPVTLASIVLGNYLQNRILLATYQNYYNKAEHGIEEFTNDLQERKLLEKQRDTLRYSRGELADVINWNVQWTPVIQILVDNLPDSMVLDKMEAIKSSDTKTVPKRYNPDKTEKISVPKRELTVQFHASAQDENHNLVTKLQSDLYYSLLPLNTVEKIELGPYSRNEQKKEEQFEIIFIFETP